MKTIVMDTSNKYLVVSLYDNGQCLDSYQEYGNQRQSEYAIVCLKDMLERHNLTMLDFEEMIITIGPGSYTGQRVALTIAKTIASVSSMKLKIVSSLQAYAGFNKVISVLDARSHKIYLGVYDNAKCIEEEKLIDIDDLDTYIKKYPDYKLVGDISIFDKEEVNVDLAKNIYEISRGEEYVTNIDSLVPKYIKGVEAKKIC